MQKPNDPQSLDQKLLTALARVGTALRASSWRGAGERGLSPTQGALLALLHARGALRPSEIAEHLRVTKPTASSVLKTLVLKGLVRVTANPADGRSRSIALTGAGRREVAHVLAWPGTLVRPLAKLPAKERARLLRTLVFLLLELEQESLLAPARICPTCVHFRAAKGRAPSQPSCALLGTPLRDADLRVECPDHLHGPTIQARR